MGRYGNQASTMNLKALLLAIRDCDTDYKKRNALVLEAMTIAQKHGYSAGIRMDPKEPDWPVAFIELPTGQVSWHLKAHPKKWDGHTAEEKYRRIDEFASTWVDGFQVGKTEYRVTGFNCVERPAFTYDPD